MFRRFPEVDAFIPNEGELGFCNIVQKRISGISALWSGPIDGVVFNLLIADGAEINRRACREKYGLITKFRQLGANYGYVGSDFCAETEEIVVSSKRFSFEDYLAIRKIGFMFHSVFVLSLYKYFFSAYPAFGCTPG